MLSPSASEYTCATQRRSTLTATIALSSQRSCSETVSPAVREARTTIVP
jgi:hypothetical protein